MVDLSTQRSIAVASFHAGTPSAFNACRMPRRRVTASKLPADIVRTIAPSGSPLNFPSFSPNGELVSKSHASSG